MSGAWAGAGATVARRRMGGTLSGNWRRFVKKKKKSGRESDYRDLHLFFKANISVEIPEAERK